jgi:hypothetical protein
VTRRHLALVTNPSASNAEAFLECGVSHILPAHNTNNKYAAKGTENHDKLTAAINKRPFSGTFHAVAKFPLAKITEGVGMLRAETAYAVNVKTLKSRFIGLDIGRNYGPLEDYEIPVSLDIEGLKEGTPWIRDWKFGRTASKVQAVVQAMARAFDPSLSGVMEVDAGFIFIDADTMGEVWYPERHVFTLEDLDEWADRFVKAFDRVGKLAEDIKTGTARTNEGDWCTYCAALPLCPAKTALVRAMLPEINELGHDIEALTVDQCGQAWSKLQMIYKLAAKVENDLKGRLEAGDSFPLPNGKLLEWTKTSGYKYLDKEKGIALLRELGASEEQLAAVMKERKDSYGAKEKKR